jgi:RNA polymerase sigma-70 factor (ECF subfamily)
LPVSTEPSSTSHSLLQRVRRLDPDAWERLCALYGPVVYGWCRRAGLQESDAADAMQDVFRSVFRGIGDFQKDGPSGSFRGWLWTITRNQVRLFFRKQGRVPQAFGGSDAQRQFAEQPEGVDDDEPADDVETRRQILHHALELVRGDFTPATWDAFARVTLQGEPIPDVAAALGMTDNAVRQAKFRVLRRLREELDGQI